MNPRTQVTSHWGGTAACTPASSTTLGYDRDEALSIASEGYQEVEQQPLHYVYVAVAELPDLYRFERQPCVPLFRAHSSWPLHTLRVAMDAVAFAAWARPPLTVSWWPDLGAPPTEPTERTRGVVSVVYRREVLLTEEVEFRTAELPRWQPRAVLGRHASEADDA